MSGHAAGRADGVPGPAGCTDASGDEHGVPRGAYVVPMGATVYYWVHAWLYWIL